MKLVRYGEAGHERPGLWVDDPAGSPRILDVRGMAYDIADYDAFFFSRHGLARVAALARENRRKEIPADAARLGPPVARPGKIICVGKNYADHAREFDAVIPESPVLFSKATTSLHGPFDDVIIEANAEHTDAEVELAVVIGRPTFRVSEDEAPGCIAGYSIVNDITDRKAQREGVQWFRGKSFDTFCPMGPWLITPDELPAPIALTLRSRLNGMPLQEGRTDAMLFGVARLISFISRNISLEPGDVIATGTPAGVGFARQPPTLLKPGDLIECEIEGIGTIANRVRARVPVDSAG
ncbi:MAG TPA: fumarylacetoacetate hydrolase family protein [Kiritimatiellia bacterium]|nr:fumarylacetoacetate hydrolase family protein [Kiritimatiellia bacterium]HMO99212.1 fumarylacetoacetate hydrolase family protein [Kiritimatiellia bacterium]